MVLNKKNSKLIYYFLIAVIFIGGVVFWQSNLESDPPMYYSGLGQSLSTDAAQYVHHARNKILFDDFDPFNYPRWTVYQHSLTSLVSYLWFSIVGVSLKNANMVGVFLSLGGIFLIFCALIRKYNNWIVLTTVLLYVINVTLITYGRLSYLENSLIFISGLFLFIYSRWHERLWGVVLSGIMVSLAMLVGKLFGILLLPVLLLTYFLKENKNCWKYIITAFFSFLVSTVLISLMLYGWDLTAAFSYIGEQSYGLRGFPEGLSSLTGFFQHLISYGYKNRLFYMNIDLVLFLISGAFLLTYKLSKGYKVSDISHIGVLSFFWVIFVILGLMPLNYSPIRYSLFLIPAIILFFVSMIEWSINNPNVIGSRKGWFHYLFLMLILWHGLFQIITLILYRNDAPIEFITWVTLPIAFGIVWVVKYLFEENKLVISKKTVLVILCTLITFSICNNIYRINEKLYLEHNTNILEANEDIAKILGEDAVISGPYAPVLTLNNTLKSFIHLFGVAEVDTALFDKYPITHLALDQSNMDEAVKIYPSLVTINQVTSYWIRDYEVRIFNISNLFNNPIANKYQKTSYEKAIEYFHRRIGDSAYIELNSFIQAKGNTKSGDMLMSNILFGSGQYQQLLPVITDFANQYPTDYYINLHCGRYLQIIGIMNKDNYYISLARKYYEQATIVNPYKADFANQLYQQTQ